jgi:hypothetical protein
LGDSAKVFVFLQSPIRIRDKDVWQVEIEAAKQACNYGFMTVVTVPDLGLCGGLLVVSENGRPKEFHCTAPVNANLAQQILYGRTLNGFLFCDQIGLALYQQAKGPIELLVTNNPELLELSQAINIPVAVLDSVEAIPPTHARQLEIDRTTCTIVGGSKDGFQKTDILLRRFNETLPLSEPFERINRAIEEAHAVVQ